MDVFAQDLNAVQTAWITLVAGVLVGAASVAAIFFAGLRKIVQAKMERWEREIRQGRAIDKEKHVIAVELMARSYEIVESLVSMEDCVDRVLLMTGTNGGGVPQVNTPYNVACLFARSTDPNKNPAALYAGPLQVDAAYMKMIRQVIRHGVVTVTRDEMPECMLRGFYEAEGVVQSRIYFLSLSPERLTYCSVASYRRKYTPGETVRIDAAVRRLRGIMDAGTDLDLKALKDSDSDPKAIPPFSPPPYPQ